MKYPMKEVSANYMSSSIYREMTPEEYEKELNFSRSHIDFYINSSGRRDREYGNYLKCWFSNKPCDGLPDYETRYRWHRLPMSPTVYMFG